MSTIRLSPSILAGDLIDLRSTLESLDHDAVDLIHMDIMDGHFVPALSYGELYSKHVRAATDIPLDVHLMVSRPEREVPKYFELEPYNITFHIEATHFPVRLAQSIRAEGIRAGVALNPGTPVGVLEPILSEIDLVLIMSVEPGYYGQSFLPGTYGKLDRLRELLGDRPIEVEVDGGIGTGNVAPLAAAGMQIAVAGSACFRGGDVNRNSRELKAAAREGVANRP